MMEQKTGENSHHVHSNFPSQSEIKATRLNCCGEMAFV